MNKLNNTVTVKINIGYNDVHALNFSTEYSILDKNKRVYTIENIKIKKWLQENNYSILDIEQFAYISGMFKPFGSTIMPSLMANYYTVQIKLSRKNIKTIDENLELTSNYKAELLNYFVHTYSLPNGQAILLKMYRTLALKYHPDKQGGNIEIMQYINELKSRYIK